MIKLTIIAITGIIALVAWLRMQWAVGQNKQVAGKMIDDLKNGTYAPESFAESLSLLVKSRPIPELVDMAEFRQKLGTLSNTKQKGKFNVQYAVMNLNDKGIVVAEGVAKDVLSATNKQVDVTYPCWIYIETDPEKNELRFKSTLPDGDDHTHLLKEITDVIYDHCAGGPAGVEQK